MDVFDTEQTSLTKRIDKKSYGNFSVSHQISTVKFEYIDNKNGNMFELNNMQIKSKPKKNKSD